ncbi:hypothetical protein J437_LFUL006913 [Ladona fulva]|uniref:Uncharacterized protein n=1 Tax=Ladona fulva TaxID=123851 RepID=A0A8K0K206_LADFU|nr:hypothetical protein J437_LFUL006913 [Ladona fulva]
MLRSTQNGAILHQGGTISGRRYSIGALHASTERLETLGESLDAESPQQHRRRHTMSSTSSRSAVIRSRELSDASPDAKKRHPKKQHYFGSEPDLRAPTPTQQLPQTRPPRMRKKYRAPAPPPTHPSGDSKESGAKGSPQRARLFRTRAETQMSSGRVLQEVNSNAAAVRSSWREGEAARRGWRVEAEVVRRSWRGPDGERSNWRLEGEELRIESERGNWGEGERREKKGEGDIKRREGGEVKRREVESKWREGEAKWKEGETKWREGEMKWRDGEAKWRERESKWREVDEVVPRREEQPANKWLSSPEFQAELLRVTLNRGMKKASSDPRSSTSRGHEKHGNKEKAVPLKEEKITVTTGSGAIEQQPWNQKNTPVKEKETPAPTPFYFGMGVEDLRLKAQEDEREKVEKFAAQLRHVRSRETWAHEDEDWRRRSDEEDAEESGIDLCLRPTLPKKQPQVPRFSPIAAWRLLGNSTAPHLPEQGVLLADGILPEKVAVTEGRGSGVIDLEPRGEKSADSGISGDASPSPGMPISRGVPSSPTVWTPQQDLAEDESSSEGSPVNVPHPPHVLYLSLSLPRTADYSLWKSSAPKGRESSLDKLRRSVSGAIFGRSDDGLSGERPLDDNWSLGRCGVRADGGQLSAGEGADSGCRGRVMYLPRGPLSPSQRCHSLDLLGGEILAGGGKLHSRPKEDWEEDAVRRVEEDFERGRALDRARLRVQLRALNDVEGEDPSIGYGPTSLPTDVKYNVEKEGRTSATPEDSHPQPEEHTSSSAPPSSSSSPLPSSSPSPSPARRRRGPPQSTAVPKLVRREWRRDVKRVPPPPTKVLSEFRQQRREYREPPKSHSSASTTTHQHIRHPSVVCDIPKTGDTKQEPSSNFHSGDLVQKSEGTHSGRNSAASTPSLTKASNSRTVSDNYRRDFAHGSLPTSSQAVDGDSEQERRSNHRNQSRPITPIGKNDGPQMNLNAKSNASTASSSCSADRRGKYNSSGGNLHDGSSRETPSDARRTADTGNNGGLKSKGPVFTSLQPYNPGKGYRPISFNPGSQTQKLAQSVS